MPERFYGCVSAGKNKEKGRNLGAEQNQHGRIKNDSTKKASACSSPPEISQIEKQS